MAHFVKKRSMQQFNIFRGTKGWLWLYERQLRLASMHNKAEAEKRLRMLIFWEKHGEEATREAFKVSRRTLYRWREALQKEQGKLQGLDKKSTAPKRRRTRRITPELAEKVIQLRKDHPRLGKKKVAVLCTLSVSKAGRILGDLKKRGLLPKYTKVSLWARSGKIHERIVKKTKKTRRPKENKQGLEIDTVVRFSHGVKRYIYTAIDINKKFAFAGCYTKHSSESASDFLSKLIDVAPFAIKEIQTDNGSEFAFHFHDACVKLGITHYHTYPRCPKMNGTIERFNRTLSDDFIMHNLPLLARSVPQFNEKMISWLIWYNAERPHEKLGMRSPLQYIVSTLPPEVCHMWWTCTRG